MSTESVRQFLSAVSTDSALQEKLAAVTDSVNFVQMVQESGYSFTLEDLQTHLAQHNGDELSEYDLEAVTGGIQGSHLAFSAVDSLSIREDLCAPGGNGSIPKGPRPGPGPGPGGVNPFSILESGSILF
jgi:predicted ribosomally synthesized peptide with nif11-like leader